jgi:hypothetical protein
MQVYEVYVSRASAALMAVSSFYDVSILLSAGIRFGAVSGMPCDV